MTVDDGTTLCTLLLGPHPISIAVLTNKIASSVHDELTAMDICRHNTYSSKAQARLPVSQQLRIIQSR
jgi:hypothetical protein